MAAYLKAYRYGKDKEKVYTGTAAEDVFTLPAGAAGYRDYIDALYNAGERLSPAAVAAGAAVVSDAMKADVLHAKDEISVSGKTYYLSNRGSDENDGLSPETPWGSIQRLRKMESQLAPGDAVLFERGSVWRKSPAETMLPEEAGALFVAKPGVSYGAYGSGRKPLLIGSPRNYADAALWRETGVPHVYQCTLPFANAGVVALDHSGEIGRYDEPLAFKEMVGRRSFTGYADLRLDGSYYNDVDEQALYLRSEKGNPGERWHDIEIGGRGPLIRNQSAALIDNLEFKYDGYGIIGGPYMNVKNCMFSYMGGCQLHAKTGETTVCGNAVEIYGPCDGLYVENCWMYQICDTGVTHQLWRDEGECIHKNIAFVGNVIEYCHWSIEFNNPPSTDGTRRTVENMTHAYNVLNMGGYGWGSRQFDRMDSATLYNGFGTAETVNGVCEKNILNDCSGGLFRMRLEGDKAIAYKQNLLIQRDDKNLGYLYDGDYPYDREAEALLSGRSIQIDPLFIFLE